MTDYRAVMDLVLQGWSVRQICSTVRCSHTTVQKARQAMAAHQIATDEQLAGVTDEEMATWFVDGRSLAQGDFVPIDFDAVAKARTGRNKVTLQVLWGRYTTQPARPSQRYYSYERFRQLVAEHVDATGLTARITHVPAHTMQVDWAGTTMRLFDPIDGRGAKVSIFVASLPYSGMLFACACPNQRQAAWLWAHIQAFEYFGGVAEVIVPDNASTASHAIGAADRNRQVNSTYEEFLEHYNTAALPARARRPKDKANVEAAVKIITQKVIHTLHGHQCVGLDELNARIRSLVDDINDAVPFRGTYTSRRMLFNEFERDVLGQLPTTPWQHTEWKRAKVAPNFHITVNTAHYSVPYQLVGRTVDVRITGNEVTVFDAGQRVATHRLAQARGIYVTDVDHIPANMADTTGLWTSDYFYREAAKIGPATQKVIAELISAKAIPAQAYQSCRNVLNMGKHANKAILEQACARLIAPDGARRAVSYTAVKNMMAAVRKDQSTRPTGHDLAPTTPPETPPAVHARDTRGAYLGGSAQFSMENLRKKGPSKS